MRDFKAGHNGRRRSALSPLGLPWSHVQTTDGQTGRCVKMMKNKGTLSNDGGVYRRQISAKKMMTNLYASDNEMNPNSFVE